MPVVRHRRPGFVLAAALLVATTAALGSLPTAATGANSPSPVPRVPPAVLSQLPPAAALPTAAGVSRALASPSSDPALGLTPQVSVVDVATGRVLFDRLASTPTIPASTQKLLTAAAALLVLGPRTRFTTRVLASGQDLYLVGGGDPTLTTAPALYGAYPASASLISLAGTTARSHRAIRRVIAVGGPPGRQYGGPELAEGWSQGYLDEGDVAPVRSLVVDEAKVNPGLVPGPRVTDPVLAAGQSFTLALSAAGARVGPASVGTAAPPSATLVASVSSPPVSALIERMLNYSDADIAEGLGRQIALRSGLPPTFAGAAEAITRVAKKLGLPAYTHIADASGLSRSNAISPQTLTSLLRDAALGRQPALRALLPALSVGGFSGTLAARFTNDAPAGAGQVRAKTGWLNGAAGLAGVVTTADGRLLAFAALVPAPVRSTAEQALDRLAGTLATCGCH